MSSSTDTPSYGQDRRKVTLVGGKVREFRANTQSRGHVGATLIYMAIRDAALRARAGLPLPPARSEPRGRDARLPVVWTQPQWEFVECTRAIEDAGSTVRDVVGAFVQAYNEHDGDHLAAAAELAGAGDLSRAS